MTVAVRRAAVTRRQARARSNVVEEIAARRRADVRDELDGLSDRRAPAAVAAAPAPRPVAERLAAPGLHLIAELKRASPSAGTIAGTRRHRRPRPRLRARRRGRDLGAVRAALVRRLGRRPAARSRRGGAPGPGQGLRRRAAPAVVASRGRRRPRPAARGAPSREARLPASSTQALDLGLEPLVEAHDERELERALATGARLIGLNNRDLRTLAVDVERAARLRAHVPDDRLVIAESGVREPAIVARWRALGFDGALVGEALMRAADPAAGVAAFVAAGRSPTDLANVARRPFVKICGVTDADGVLAAIRAGCRRDRAQPRSRDAARAGGRRGRRARPPHSFGRASRSRPAGRRASPPTLRRELLAGDRRGDRPGRRSSSAATSRVEPPGGSAGRAWKVLHLPRPAVERRPPRQPSRATSSRAACLPRRRCRAAPPRHRRRATSRRDGPSRARIGSRRDRPRGAGHARRRARPGNVARCPARRAGRRRRRRLGRRATRAAGAEARRVHEGPIPRRAVRQAGPGGSRRPPQPAVRPDPHARRPAGCRRSRPLGHGARVRRALRARDADGRAGAARDGLRRAPPGPRVLGRAAASSSSGSPGDRPRSTGPTAWPRRSAPRHSARPPATPGLAARRASRRSGSTSSARTSPTPAPTRSTTPSARRC